MIITTLGAKVKAGGKMLHGFFKASPKKSSPCKFTALPSIPLEMAICGELDLSRNRKTGDFWTEMPAKGIKAPLSSFATSTQNWRGAEGEDFSWRPAEYVYRVKTINFEKAVEDTGGGFAERVRRFDLSIFSFHPLRVFRGFILSAGAGYKNPLNPFQVIR